MARQRRPHIPAQPGRHRAHRRHGVQLLQRPPLHRGHTGLSGHHGERCANARLRGLGTSGRTLHAEPQGSQSAQPRPPADAQGQRHRRGDCAEQIPQRTRLQPRPVIQSLTLRAK